MSIFTFDIKFEYAGDGEVPNAIRAIVFEEDPDGCRSVQDIIECDINGNPALYLLKHLDANWYIDLDEINVEWPEGIDFGKARSLKGKINKMVQQAHLN